MAVARESDITKERIAKILAAGTNVVLTTGGIDDLCLKYFVETGCMGVRRCKKEDLKRIARATGGQTKLKCYCSMLCCCFAECVFQGEGDTFSPPL